MWKVGDWCVYDMKVGQIKELRPGGGVTFSDGFFETHGNFLDWVRPLTLKNKRIAETFETYYGRLSHLDGESGFNYPDIHQYFAKLALATMDAEDANAGPLYAKAQDFVIAARDLNRVIDGVRLFRPKVGVG